MGEEQLYRVLVEKLKGGDYLEDICIDGGIMLK